MEKEFWLDKWDKEQIGFHLSEVNPNLVEHIDRLALKKGDRIFIPLCGKTVDIVWLLQQGYKVVGIDLSQKAIEAVFEQMQVTPEVTTIGDLTRYQFERLELYVGDIFSLTKDILGPVHAVYDRAALVALPPDIRKRYTKYLTQNTDTAKQLLVTLTYDQSLMDGPPFSITHEMVKRQYWNNYTIELLKDNVLEEEMRGVRSFREPVMLLKPLKRSKHFPSA
jgi:thiopurine S-methyltransferase